MESSLFDNRVSWVLLGFYSEFKFVPTKISSSFLLSLLPSIGICSQDGMYPDGVLTGG
jgi:hypothetical protein